MEQPKTNYSFTRNLHTFWLRYGIWLMFIVLVIISSVASDRFLTQQNIFNVMRQVSINGILAVGMTFVILTAGIDLSVGALLALIACTSAGMIYFHGVNTFWIVLAAVVFGAMLGAVNGSLITLGRMQPFIVTLAMMTSARGVAFLYTDGRPIVLGDKTPDALNFLGEGYFHTENIIGIGPIPVPVVILLVIVILAAIILEKTPFGRYVYGIGSNSEAMRLSGINVKLQTTFVYTISGALCGLAGVIALSRLGVGNADLGMGFELNAIAAVVVGGTSLSGGIGGVGGTLIGALIIGVLDNILNLKGVSAFIQQILKGVIILTAVFLAQRRKD